MQYISEKQNNKPINIQIVNTDNLNNYRISAITDNGDEMGFATFSIKKKDRSVWLRKIETNPQYQNLGVAKAILDVLEYFAVDNRLCLIEGKFYPDNEFAKPFYKKNNYDIHKEDYETYVSKYIGHESVSDETRQRIIGYEVLPAPDTLKEM